MDALALATAWLYRAQDWRVVLSRRADGGLNWPTPDCFGKKPESARKRAKPKTLLVSARRSGPSTPRATVCPRKRKRRRQDQSPRLAMPWFKPPILTATELIVRQPRAPAEGYTVVLNAFACIFPVEGTIRLFGVMHPVVVVGALFRHQNLCFVLVSRASCRLFLSSHFVADGLHFFERWRNRLGFPRERHWNRQGVNEIFSFLDAEQAPVRLSTLPRGVLQYTNTQQTCREVFEFVRGAGKWGQFLQRFARRTLDFPPGFVPLLQQQQLQRLPNRRFPRKCEQDCPCHAVRLDAGLQRLALAEKAQPELTAVCLAARYPDLAPTPPPATTEQSLTQRATLLMASLPSSLDDFAPLQRHFAPFVAYMQREPEARFWPQA